MALKLPKSIVVAEVGPRDGLQSFPRWIDTDIKVAIIDRLSDLGSARYRSFQLCASEGHSASA